MTPAKLSSAAQKLTDEGLNASPLVLDVRDGVSVANAFAQVNALDVVVANARIQKFTTITALSEAAWNRTSEVNARGVFLTLQKASQILCDGGAMVVVASIRGYLPNTTSIYYAASKAASLSVMKSFAKELGPRGIRVNAVAPGRIELLERGIPIAEEYVSAGDFDPATGRSGLMHLVGLRKRPTAIFAASDSIALGVLAEAHAQGVSVPKDLSVVGFDGTLSSEQSSPELTTVAQPLREMGRTAVRAVLREMAGGIPDSTRIELATHLIVRSSTAPPPPDAR